MVCACAVRQEETSIWLATNYDVFPVGNIHVSAAIKQEELLDFSHIDDIVCRMFFMVGTSGGW